MSLLRNLFGGRSRGFNRRSGYGGYGGRSHALANMFGRHRGGMTIGALAALAAPFIVRKLRSRRQQRAFYGAAY